MIPVKTALLWAVLFYSCTNDIVKVRNFLADKHLPVGTARNIHTVYKDSGMVATILDSPLMYDYAMEKMPYMEFPEGIRLMRYYGDRDSTLVTGKYAVTYTKTELSELRDSVTVINYLKAYTLKTEQLYWDQKLHYFITGKKFVLYTPRDTIYGEGFESTEDLENWHTYNNTGSVVFRTDEE